MLGNFKKLMEGMQGINDTLNKALTPEVLKAMTPEQLEKVEEFKKTMKGTDLKDLAKNMENMAKNI